MIPIQRSERQRGATAVIVALMLTVLCGFVALVMNSGHVMAVRNQLQNATDAAALAGVRELNGTVAGVTSAQLVAANYAQLHITDKGMAVTIDPATDVVVGTWNFAAPRASAFTAISAAPTASQLAAANAVLVNAGREASRNNPLDVFMGALLGKQKTDVSASAVAVMGGPGRNTCGLLPLAFSSCAVTNDDGTLKCDATLTFNSNGADNMGFTNLIDTSGVTPPVMKQILGGSCPVVSVGQPIWVQNGSDLTPVLADFRKYVGTQALVPVVDVPGCQFVSAGVGAVVSGFMTVTITKVNGAPLNSIDIQIDCTTSPVATLGGGGNFGTTATQPMLVR